MSTYFEIVCGHLDAYAPVNRAPEMRLTERDKPRKVDRFENDDEEKLKIDRRLNKKTRCPLTTQKKSAQFIIKTSSLMDTPV